MILTAWIGAFGKENGFSRSYTKWEEVIAAAFSKGTYDQKDYKDSYHEIWVLKPKDGRWINFANFYSASLLHDYLDKRKKMLYLGYILQFDTEIYSICGRSSKVFYKQNASCYPGAMKLLSEY